MIRRLLTDMETDPALRGVVLMNVAVVLGALVAGDGVVMLMIPYWTQSVVIGLFNARRIAALREFRTAGLKINGRVVEATPSVQRQTWVFFLIHYGFFHFIYLMFMGVFSTMARSGGAFSGFGSPTGYSSVWLLVTAVGYLVSEGREHAADRAADDANPPNIGNLMFAPYVRIIPMHLTIIVGALIGGWGAVLLFGTLKTMADVAMLKVERQIFEKERAKNA
jgi:hypothetical protein